MVKSGKSAKGQGRLNKAKTAENYVPGRGTRFYKGHGRRDYDQLQELKGQ